MALKTPERYLDEIRARDLRIFYRGRRFENPVDDPVAAPAARCVAETYAAALEPGTGMAAASPLVGEPVNVSNLLWTSRDHLIARVKWERLIGRRTGRGALRSPGLDAINALAVVTHACDRARGTEYHGRLMAFVERIQRDDLAVSGAMTDVRGDRSRRPAAQADPDLFLRVVDRDAKGVVLRGAKAHQTSAIHCHEHVVLPMTCGPGEDAWAIACAVPSDAPGVTHIYARQPSDSRRAEDASATRDRRGDRRELELEEGDRIDHAAGYVDGDVHVRPGGAAGVPGEADLVALRDGATFRDRDLAQVKIRRRDAAAVRDHDHVAGEEAVAYQHDGAGVDRLDLGTLACKQVEAEVLAAVAVIERAPLAKHRRDLAQRPPEHTSELWLAPGPGDRMEDRGVVRIDPIAVGLRRIGELVLDHDIGLWKRVFANLHRLPQRDAVDLDRDRNGFGVERDRKHRLITRLGGKELQRAAVRGAPGRCFAAGNRHEDRITWVDDRRADREGGVSRRRGSTSQRDAEDRTHNNRSSSHPAVYSHCAQAQVCAEHLARRVGRQALRSARLILGLDQRLQTVRVVLQCNTWCVVTTTEAPPGIPARTHRHAVEIQRVQVPSR
jgi:hypothetical protein